MKATADPLDVLIATKCREPDLIRPVIPRFRLHEKLNQAVKRQVTVVSAPAGYGKSTAVLDWLGSQSLEAAWVSLDTKDNEPHLFWRYVCCALGRIDRSIQQDTRYVFQSHELFRTNIHLNIMLDKLGKIRSDVFLILDDFHTISEPGILDGMSYFIEYLPANTHLILISRSEPGLELAHLEIKGRLTRLYAEDLRFQRTEILRFYEKRGLRLAEQDLDLIERYSEGWAAALVVTAIYLKDARDGTTVRAGIVSSQENIHRYFLEEVYRAWSETEREFFLKTSILDALTGPLCDAVAGREDSGALLDRLQGENSYLSHVDKANDWYRYHSIFRDFLLNRLSDSGIQPAELHSKAARWFLENGYTNQAIEHFLDGGNPESALKVIEQRSVAIIDGGTFRTALSWIRRIPDSLTDNSLQVAAIRAAFHAHRRDFRSAHLWGARMEAIAAGRQYRTEEEKSFAAHGAQLIRAHILSLQGDMAGAGKILRTVAESGGARDNLIDYVDFNPGSIYFHRCPSRNLIALYGTRPDLYRELLENYQSLIHSDPPGYGYLIAGESLYERDRLDEALPALLAAVEKADAARCAGALVPGMVTLARISRVRGDIHGAIAAIDACEEKLESIRKMHWNYPLRAFRARLLLASGDTDEADRWFDSCRLGIYQELSDTREFELLVFARFLLAYGRTGEANTLLLRLLDHARTSSGPHSAVEILNLLAIAAHDAGRHDQAADYLEKSLILGIEAHYIRSYADEGPVLAGLLRRFPAQGREQRRYVHELLEHFPDVAESVDDAGSGDALPDVMRLTPREDRVLRLLAEGLTNQQISDALGISVSTTKIHLGNIYGKLQVTTRLQCVNEARKRGLLP